MIGDPMDLSTLTEDQFMCEPGNCRREGQHPSADAEQRYYAMLDDVPMAA